MFLGCKAWPSLHRGWISERNNPKSSQTSQNPSWNSCHYIENQTAWMRKTTQNSPKRVKIRPRETIVIISKTTVVASKQLRYTHSHEITQPDSEKNVVNRMKNKWNGSSLKLLARKCLPQLSISIKFLVKIHRNSCLKVEEGEGQ